MGGSTVVSGPIGGRLGVVSSVVVSIGAGAGGAGSGSHRDAAKITMPIMSKTASARMSLNFFNMISLWSWWDDAKELR